MELPDWVRLKPRLLAKTILLDPVRPEVVMATLPVVVLLVVKLPLKVTAPPKIVMGPATETALFTTIGVLVLVALPKVKLVKLGKDKKDELTAV